MEYGGDTGTADFVLLHCDVLGVNSCARPRYAEPSASQDGFSVLDQRKSPSPRWAFSLVETQGLEPWTPCLQSRCSSQLSYVPTHETNLRFFSSVSRQSRPASGQADLLFSPGVWENNFYIWWAMRDSNLRPRHYQ